MFYNKWAYLHEYVIIELKKINWIQHLNTFLQTNAF